MRIWVDSDMGFDDLAAIGLCLSEGVKIEGLSLVAGNVALPQVLVNAMDAKDAFGWQMPLYLGAARPLRGELQTASYVLGESGMKTVGRHLPPARRARAPHGEALPALAEWLAKGGETVLALGPLTNIAEFVIAYPDLAARMRLIWMGGAFARGNHTAVAEFNAAVDPEAIETVLAAGVDLTMVGLECCREVSLGLESLSDLRAQSSAGAALIADLFEGYLRIADNGKRPMALYDPVAAACAIAPELFDYQAVAMRAETEGRYCRGMTVIEWRAHKAEPNVMVALAPKAQEITARFLRALNEMAKAYDANA